MNVSAQPRESASSLRYRVDGMDCASCALKIETVVRRIDGVDDLSVNVTTGLLEVVARGGADREEIANAVRKLGYDIRSISGHATAPPIEVTASEPGGGESGSHHDHAGHDHVGHDHARHHGSRNDLAPKAENAVVAKPKADPHAGHLHASDPDEGNDAKPWWRKAKGRLVIALAVLVGGSMLLALAEPGYAQWIFAAAALIGVVPFASRAVTLARAGIPFSIETLMSIAVVGALAIGAAEEGAVVVLLFAVGELIEGIAAGSARSGIRALVALMPSTALIEELGATRTVDVGSLQPGQVLVVRPGDRVATDGEIIEGTSDVDQAAITGESTPVSRGPGDSVFAGSINANAVLKVRVTRTIADNTIARIIEEVENAQSKKAPLARFIDNFSRWYTPGALAAAIIVAVVPPLLFGGDWSTWIYRALALLLIACPCALVLSTPAAIASGIAAAARRGLLIKSGAALEALGHVKTVAFDKTGTLTAGRPRVTDVVALMTTETDVLAFAAAVEVGSAHPIAKAIVDAAAERSLVIAAATGASADPGLGVSAIVGGRRLSVLSPRAAAERLAREARSVTAAMEQQGKTVVVLVDDTTVLGLIAVRDEPRADAAAAIRQLLNLGVRSVMLTGDNARTAQAIATTLGLEAKADLMPSQKLLAIEAMALDGPVAMVGDGINDAPALAAASVGIAMGGGTEVALTTADAALLGGRVAGVAELIEISRATLFNIHQNIAIALGLKAIFLFTSLAGVTSLWMAILADTGATVIVTANALRLLRRGRRLPAPRREQRVADGPAGPL
jgi:Cd2+/Zn2+-exporting ATPase